MPRSHTGVRGMVFVDKMSGPAYGISKKWDSFCAAMQQKVKAGEEMELLESQKTKEEWKFPKNIRQIGEPGTGRRILIHLL